MTAGRALRVGVVGLGAMGGPIARHLAAAGRTVSCVDPDPDAAARVGTEGLVLLDSPAELGARVDVVVVTVPSDEDVARVCSADGGLLTRPGDGLVVLVSSSVRPQTCREIGARAAARGVDVLDAALTGGVRAAESGSLTLLVGGDAAVLDRVRPALEPWTSAVHLLGDLGAGQVGKTVNNLCHWGQVSVVVEALRLGRALGVEPALLRPALLAGPVASRTLAELELMHLRWHAKDLANAFAMAEAVDAALPVASEVRRAMREVTVDDVTDLFRPG